MYCMCWNQFTEIWHQRCLSRRAWRSRAETNAFRNLYVKVLAPANQREIRHRKARSHIFDFGTINPVSSNLEAFSFELYFYFLSRRCENEMWTDKELWKAEILSDSCFMRKFWTFRCWKPFNKVSAPLCNFLIAFSKCTFWTTTEFSRSRFMSGGYFYKTPSK